MHLNVNEVACEANVTNKAPPRVLSPIKQEALRLIIQQLLDLDVIEPSQAVSRTQVHLVPKPGQNKIDISKLTPQEIIEQWRFCLDYRLLNSLSEAMGWIG